MNSSILNLEQTDSAFSYLESLEPVNVEINNNCYVGVFKIGDRYFKAEGYHTCYLGLTIESYSEVRPKSKKIVDYE